MIHKKVLTKIFQAQTFRRIPSLPSRKIARALLVLQLGMIFNGCSSPSGHGSFATRLPETKTVSVIVRHEGETTHFYVENKEFCEVTMTFEMGLANLKGNQAFPYTAAFPAQETTEAFSVSPIEPGTKWSYS